MASNDKIPNKVEVPKDQSAAAQVASPIASLSSHFDPETHYVAAAVCAGTAGLLHMRNNPRTAAAAAGFSLLYISAGRLITSGKPQLGYDLGSATSLGLLAWAGSVPGTGVAAANAVMGTVGGMSAVANLIKSYKMRTGKPHEMIEH